MSIAVDMSSQRRAMASPNLAYEALADPTRREILNVLAQQPECRVADIATAIDTVGRTTISSHLRVLRMAGLVSERRDGRYRLYSLEPGPAQQVVDFLMGLYRSTLSDLKAAAERESPPEEPGSS